MAYRQIFDQKVLTSIHVRMTKDQRQEVRKVAALNSMTVSGVIREAIICFVSDCQEAPSKFRGTKS